MNDAWLEIVMPAHDLIVWTWPLCRRGKLHLSGGLALDPSAHGRVCQTQSTPGAGLKFTPPARGRSPNMTLRAVVVIAILATLLTAVIASPCAPRWAKRAWFIKGRPRRAPLPAVIAVFLVSVIAGVLL